MAFERNMIEYHDQSRNKDTYKARFDHFNSADKAKFMNDDQFLVVTDDESLRSASERKTNDQTNVQPEDDSSSPKEQRYTL